MYGKFQKNHQELEILATDLFVILSLEFLRAGQQSSFPEIRDKMATRLIIHTFSS
jgi:hypothetical protein